MNYSDAIQFLYELRLFGLKFGLENTFRLAELMGRPQDKLRFIHVAGTNGKGSTCAMLESIYRAAGLRVGLFTSPHLVSFAERIQVNRQLIAPKDVARLVGELKGLEIFSGGDETCPTFFEAVTVMALKYFAEQSCDLVIWETGLGGRLDATNIVTPLASVITNVQLDHQQWLGQTLPEIAREKAGIIKEGVPIVTSAEDAEIPLRTQPNFFSLSSTPLRGGEGRGEEAPRQFSKSEQPDMSRKEAVALSPSQKNVPPLPSPLLHKFVEERESKALVDSSGVLSVIAEVAKSRHAPLTVVSPAEADAMKQYELGLAGAHQRKNAALALRVVKILNDTIAVPDEAIRRGLKETRWDGRNQIIQRNGQTILLDGAHNPAGAETLSSALAEHDWTLILGMMGDKDCETICRILAPRVKKIFLTPLGSERSANPATLADYCRKANPTAQVTVCKNLADAFSATAAEPFVLAAGSLYLVGEALEILGLAPPSPERALNENASGLASPTPIRAVTFDIGGTLIEPWPSVGHVFAQVAKRHGFDIAPEVLNKNFAAAWKAKKDFAHKKSDWSALVDGTFAGLIPCPPSSSFFEELFAEFTKPEAWRVYDDVVPCLEKLRRDGLKLGAISNWDDRLRPLLAKLGLDKYFDTIVISCEAGHSKPAPEIFRLAANHLMTPPSAILHIGDSQKEDVESARTAGFQAVLLSRGKPPAAPGTISSLKNVSVSYKEFKVDNASSNARIGP
jgi:dihydrofolate synthase/folylpolyglutamate synthase